MRQVLFFTVSKVCQYAPPPTAPLLVKDLVFSLQEGLF